MEKKSIHRYCFATPRHDSFFRTAATWELGSIQLFEYKTHQLAVVETSSEMTAEKLQSELVELWGITPETLSNSLTERIFWKYANRKADLSLHQSLAWNDSKRVVMSLELKNDPELLAAYKEVHQPEHSWPQVLQNMDTMGVKDMELYLQGYQVFLLMDVPSNFDLDKEGEKWGQLPREQEWQNYVARFQKTDPQGKIEEKWTIMSTLSSKIKIKRDSS